VRNIRNLAQAHLRAHRVQVKIIQNQVLPLVLLKVIQRAQVALQRDIQRVVLHLQVLLQKIIQKVQVLRQVPLRQVSEIRNHLVLHLLHQVRNIQKVQVLLQVQKVIQSLVPHHQVAVQVRQKNIQ